MRIATYYPWIYLKGGIERTILELANRSRHDWTVFTSHYRPEDTFPGYADLDVRQIGSVSVKRNALSVAAACARLLAQSTNWDGYDALMINCDGVGNLLALRARGLPLLCLCHTPLKISYDPHARERWLRLFRPNFLTRAGVSLFRQVDRLAWKRYKRVFCVSTEVQRRLRSAGVVTPQRTQVIHPGVDVDTLVPTGKREPFFLMPGRVMWSKNIELGLQAFFDFKSRSDDPAISESRLVIAGMVDDKSRWYFAHLKELAAGRGDVEFVACPSDEVLFDLYDRCTAVLFTPPNEDWGIVPLEAMAFGKPVIAIERGGPAESIAHEETGFLCSDDPSTWAESMVKLTTDPALYERQSRAARQRAQRYDWQSFVDEIDEYLDGLAAPMADEQPLAVQDAHRV